MDPGERGREGLTGRGPAEDGPIGIYLHVPFCTIRCSYCDFYLLPEGARGAGPAGRASFVEALVGEIEAAAARHGPLAADTVHFGGGTPSLLDPEAIGRVLAALRRGFRLAPDAEIALEANPEDLTPARCGALAGAGISRLAVGVQALDDEILRRLRRPHDRQGAIAALRAARPAGFRSLAADLILALPGQDATGAIDGLRTLLDLRVDHVSLYLLEIHETTRLGRAIALGRETPPSQDEAASVWEAAVETLAAAGFEQYEISNFARPGHRSRHNLKYWTDAPYLGFGPAAHSYLGGERWSNPPDLAAYVLAGGRLEPRREPAPAADRAREALYAGLRLAEGIDLDRLRRRYGPAAPVPDEARLAPLRDAGLVTLTGARLALTRRGRIVSNEVLERLS
jgi:oxygen-independent coproporphyrinogen-3 oxidase